MLSDYKIWRKLRKGIWYYVRPYDNLYSFQHMRYWINRIPSRTEVVLKHEMYFNGKQYTYVFCDNCGIEMISNNCCVKDDAYVHFSCWRCGCDSVYDFDCPVPMLLSSQGGEILLKSDKR